jgi:hypothetical protein
MAPSVVLFTSVGIGIFQQLNSLTSSATTVTTRCGGSDTSHFTVGVLRLEVKKKIKTIPITLITKKRVYQNKTSCLDES